MTPRPVADAFSFFRAWLRHPLRVASVAPSGRALAELMTAEISTDTGPVIELGPGTGAFTRALIGRGVKEQDLALIELDAGFSAALQIRYPRAQMFQINAGLLHTVTLFSGVHAGATVSGLPLLSMPGQQVRAILVGAFGKMRAQGAFYQFTYGPRCPVPAALLHHLGLEAHRVGWVVANFPPAAVYRIVRRPLAGSRAPFEPSRPRSTSSPSNSGGLW